MSRRILFGLIILALVVIAGCSRDSTQISPTPDATDIKITGKKMVGENMTVAFKYDTKDPKGGSVSIELWDERNHMHDEYAQTVKNQKGRIAWTFKPTFAGSYKFWFNVKNSEDESTASQSVVVAETTKDDPKIRREVATKFTGLWNMEYQNVDNWPEYQNWNGNVLIITYNDNTVRLVAEKDTTKTIRDGVIDGDTLIFEDKERKTVHRISYFDELRLRGEFESPAGKKRADISMVRN